MKILNQNTEIIAMGHYEDYYEHLQISETLFNLKKLLQQF